VPNLTIEPLEGQAEGPVEGPVEGPAPVQGGAPLEGPAPVEPPAASTPPREDENGTVLFHLSFCFSWEVRFYNISFNFAVTTVQIEYGGKMVMATILPATVTRAESSEPSPKRRKTDNDDVCTVSLG